MSFNFGSIKPRTDEATLPTSPVRLFYKLDHPTIADLYPIQSTVLEKWAESKERGDKSTVISLDTGAGKTLVGLLIAESLRRSTNGKVLYVCPDNYLVAQTVERATEYGIGVSCYRKSKWEKEEEFLQNHQICITNYDSVYNARSRFREMDIVGCVLDDAHLALDKVDQQYSLTIPNTSSAYLSLLRIFSSSPIWEKLERVIDGDPQVNTLIPPLEWYTYRAEIAKLLTSTPEVQGELAWGYLQNILDRCLCFVSASKIDISPLYPSTDTHYLSDPAVYKVLLSATLPNRDDLMRIFGIETHRIESNNPDYRPERLFVYTHSLAITPSPTVEEMRAEICKVADKTLVLVPSHAKLHDYRTFADTVDTTEEMEAKLGVFKNSERGVLALSNRYDGIDLPGSTCHSLVVDGLPVGSSLKTRFFSENFHNHKNSYLRSLIASKLIQAFGRTVRGYNDYSIVFLLGDKLNSWLLNADNQRFFRADVTDDLVLGLNLSRQIETMDDLKEMATQMLNQVPQWKEYVKSQRTVTEVTESINLVEEDASLVVAKLERQILSVYHTGDWKKCMELINHQQANIRSYSKPLLGLYLSMAAVCAHALKDIPKTVDYSAQAYGINPMFGQPRQLAEHVLSLQAGRIISNQEPVIREFVWERKETEFGKMFDEHMKILGEFLGFDARRPENEKDGTLDVLWVDEESRVVLGFELKVDKKNYTLDKADISQCHDHREWLKEKYQGYDCRVYAVGDFNGYNTLATPSDLLHASIDMIRGVSAATRAVYHVRDSAPERVDAELSGRNLRLRGILEANFVRDLPKVNQ
jgi:hypothetical protein